MGSGGGGGEAEGPGGCVWALYQVLEGVSCSECFLLIHTVCVCVCVIPAEASGGRATSAYVIHGWTGPQVPQVKLMTTTVMMMMTPKQKRKTSVSHLESAL